MRKETMNPILVLVVLVLVVGLFMLLLQANTGAQPSQPQQQTQTPQTQVQPQQIAAANQGLDTFRTLVTQENYQALGFTSPDEVKQAVLGEPLKVFRIPLDQLKQYDLNTASSAGNNPEKLLVDVSQSIYPVIVENQVRSSISVEQSGSSGSSGGNWSPTDFGSPSLIEALSKARQNKDDFVVQVPALNLYFVARRSDSGLLLTPITDDPSLRFTAGQPMPIQDVLTIIQPVAKQTNDLPGGK
jgi:hypothetical protein